MFQSSTVSGEAAAGHRSRGKVAKDVRWISGALRIELRTPLDLPYCVKRLFPRNANIREQSIVEPDEILQLPAPAESVANAFDRPQPPSLCRCCHRVAYGCR